MATMMFSLRAMQQSLFECSARSRHYRQCLHWEWDGLFDRKGLLYIWPEWAMCEYTHSMFFLIGLHPFGSTRSEAPGMQGCCICWCLLDLAEGDHGRNLPASGQNLKTLHFTSLLSFEALEVHISFLEEEFCVLVYSWCSPAIVFIYGREGSKSFCNAIGMSVANLSYLTKTAKDIFSILPRFVFWKVCARWSLLV